MSDRFEDLLLSLSLNSNKISAIGEHMIEPSITSFYHFESKKNSNATNTLI